MAFLTLAVSSTTVQPFGFSDLALGAAVPALIKAHGSPDVVTTDVGQIWTWDLNGSKVRVTTNDDGSVQLFDLVANPQKPATFVLPGTQFVLTFGIMPIQEADLRFKSIEDFSAHTTFPDSGAKADVRAYPIAAGNEALLLFDQTTQTLGEIIYGRREALSHAGFLPAGTSAAFPKFTAPVIVHQDSADYPTTTTQGDAFVRVSVDATGAVSAATIFVSTGDIVLDRAAVASAKHYAFKPATRDGVAVPSVFFHKEIFRSLPKKL